MTSDSGNGSITYFKFISNNTSYLNYVLSKLNVIMAKYDNKYSVCSVICYDDNDTTSSDNLFNDRVIMSQKHGIITFYSHDTYNLEVFLKAVKWINLCGGCVYKTCFEL
ncbi:hypothetical protein [Psilogramma increta granulovirus]|uniref:Uncharacterized protein n=1 Tax=Psilogramma increta granulovirus TaxID=2953508 RepID=A0A977TNW7_9BBAC|nr:hypothetical protein [Psilogramma increta granulovirus]